MLITVNSKEYNIGAITKVSELLEFFKIQADKVAVEKNGNIIDCNNYTSESVTEGDGFELIRFMGGG